jgi:hypothetical protein
MRTLHRTLILALVATFLGGSRLDAQQSVVFVHGLNSSGDTWEAAAQRLQQELDVQIFRPTQPWWDIYQNQAWALQNKPEIGSLPDSTIAFGHSNGGVVAREWSKFHRLSGLATIGTPHRGAPIVSHIYDWVNFNDSARILDEQIVGSFGTPHNQHLNWVLHAVLNESLGWVRWFKGYAIYEAMYFAGLNPAATILMQMRPPSAYLETLNSGFNLQREAEVPHRVGIVNVPPNYLFGGPLRLIVPPEHADEAAVVLHAAGAALFYYGAFVQGNADMNDPHGLADASDKASFLAQLGQWINEIEVTWCALVSSTGPGNGGDCIENDSLVPYPSQLYPGALNVGYSGAAHTWETRYSGDAIYWVLHHVMGVQPPSAPPPAPPPGPEPPPAPPTGGGVLGPYESLYSDQSRTSPNGRFMFYYQGDGNLVAYRDGVFPFWSTGTDGTSTGSVTMQGDGNLVVLDADGNCMWSSNTWGNEGAFLNVQDDGNLVIYRADGVPIWATGTNGS